MNLAPEDKPLAGLRVIALTQAWAGPFATELLAFLGADVIQIESRRRPDNFRGPYGGTIPLRLQGVGRAKHPWNVAASYNSVNLNKRAITLDLTGDEGREIFRKLVAISDVVAENFSPRVMQNFGLHYEALKKVQPSVIMLSMSAYGADGPYANYPGIGGTIEAMSGMTSLLGYPGEPGMNSGTMYPDPVAGYMGAVALMMALAHRDRTGEGQWIDLSMQEANITFIGDALLEFILNGTVRVPLGNRHPAFAPHGMYPSRDGRWIAIAVTTEAAFRELGLAAGHPEWNSDQRYITNEQRLANVGSLERELEHWTSTLTAAEIEACLASTDVSHALVLTIDEVIARDDLRRRGILAEIEHPESGRQIYVAAPWLVDGKRLGPFTPAPCLGEHSQSVFAELLGMSTKDYDRLVSEGVTGETPPV